MVRFIISVLQLCPSVQPLPLVGVTKLVHWFLAPALSPPAFFIAGRWKSKFFSLFSSVIVIKAIVPRHLVYPQVIVIKASIFSPRGLDHL